MTLPEADAAIADVYLEPTVARLSEAIRARGGAQGEARASTVEPVTTVSDWQHRLCGALQASFYAGQFALNCALLYFGYTFCPDVCPADNARNAEALDMLLERGYDAQMAFVSVDPERDDPERLRDFTDPAALMDITEMRDTLADAIARLPEREKIVIALYYYDQLTLREIGEVLGVTERTVYRMWEFSRTWLHHEMTS